jgi:hypothetical protein
MDEDFAVSRPILRALLATGCAAVACGALRAAGLGPDPSLIAGLAIAGSLNILGLASLNRDGTVPTSGQAVGENWP